jgi:prolyl-tRNA synthetase
MAQKKNMDASSPIIIKKYANRRLYTEFRRLVSGGHRRGRNCRGIGRARLHGDPPLGLWHLGTHPEADGCPIKAAGVENCYFPLFIPLSFFAKEAEHVDGFAKEMAVVTHHRLIGMARAELVPDPEAKLEEPLVVRPTSKRDRRRRWRAGSRAWRDLPLLTNQWANVVRWEMRTRMFLRTSEFLWQEGHTAHADKADAMAETLRALEMYRAFAEGPLAMPVWPARSPRMSASPAPCDLFDRGDDAGRQGAAGRHQHYLGTGFAEAAGIRYQDKEGQQLCHTTSWGVSTRLIGGVIMTHGDDDGLRVPPQIAPQQIVILPMLRDNDEDAALLAYCEDLRRALAGRPRWASRSACCSTSAPARPRKSAGAGSRRAFR